MSYLKEELEFLLHKIDYEGFDYALVEYSDWPEFGGTPLGDAIENYRQACDLLNEEIEKACEVMGIELED